MLYKTVIKKKQTRKELLSCMYELVTLFVQCVVQTRLDFLGVRVCIVGVVYRLFGLANNKESGKGVPGLL